MLLAGASVWCGRPQQPAATTCVTGPVLRGALAVTVTATGRVQPTTEVEVSSGLSGTLRSVVVDDNDAVEVGEAVFAVGNAGLLLRPGMTATATITVAEAQAVLRVPNAALRYAPPQAAEGSGSGAGGLVGLILPRPPGSGTAGAAVGKTVWVLRDGARVEVPVTPGASDGKHTIITAGDLVEGDPVITGRRTAAP